MENDPFWLMMASASRALESVCERVLQTATPEIWAMMSEIEPNARGTSALDCFLYHNSAKTRGCQASEAANDGEEIESIDEIEGCASHVDPGLMTVAPPSLVQGLELLDQASKEWLKVEEASHGAHPSPQLVLFSGKLLHRISSKPGESPGTSGIQPMQHRVRCLKGVERVSLLFEMRLREADVSGWLCKQEAKALGLA